MRPLILAFALTCATASPAPAQVSPQTQHNLDLMAQQQQELQRSVALENEINTLDARVQSAERLRAVETSRTNPSLLLPPSDPNARTAPSSTGNFASIPDAALADSQQRVKEASQNKR